MDILNPAALKSLIAQQGRWCVSLYMPTHRVPIQFEELLMTGTSFHIKPLLPCLGRGIKFYVLAVSLNNVRLFEGNADGMSEIELNFPTSIESTLWMDEREKFLNLHSGSTSMGEGKGGSGIFH